MSLHPAATSRMTDALDRTSTPVPADRKERRTHAFVWGVWGLLLLVALCVLFSYGRNIGIAEDWHLVAPLAGHEPSLPTWAWAQNNEHRIPLPRVILLTVLKITNGDFRAGMMLNVLTMAGIAAAMMMTARALRGERASLVDAIFPIVFLNIGNWENLFWSWQFTFVLPTALTCALLIVLVLRPTLSTIGAATAAGACAILLPLCGANGLLIVPLLTPWLAWRALQNWRDTGPTEDAPATARNERRMAGLIVASCTVLAAVLCCIYFIGYVKPTWNTPSPSVGASIKTGLKCLSYVWGPIASRSWGAFSVMALLLVIPTGLLAMLAMFRERGTERVRAIGLLLIFAILLLIEAAVGHARAGQVKQYGIPIRYVLFASTVLCATFFLWQLYGPSRVRPVFAWGLLVVLVLLMPANNVAGWSMWGAWYDGEMDKMETDLARGITAEEFVRRHKRTLVHWWPEDRVVRHLYMLKRGRMGPFVQLKDAPPATTRTSAVPTTQGASATTQPAVP
jgi:hypothetical protein